MTFIWFGRSPGIAVTPLVICSEASEFQTWQHITYTKGTRPNWRCFLSQLGTDTSSPLMLFRGEFLLYRLSGFQQRLLCKLSESEITACQVPLKNEILSTRQTSSGNFAQPARSVKHSSLHAEDSRCILFTFQFGWSFFF